MPYVAAVLDHESRKNLIEKIRPFVPEGFEIVAHHHTLHMGDARPGDSLGASLSMTANEVAVDERVVAVRLCAGGGLSDNEVPHITVAVNRAAGGKPFHSNFLQSWEKIPFISLKGKIEVCN